MACASSSVTAAMAAGAPAAASRSPKIPPMTLLPMSSFSLRWPVRTLSHFWAECGRIARKLDPRALLQIGLPCGSSRGTRDLADSQRPAPRIRLCAKWGEPCRGAVAVCVGAYLALLSAWRSPRALAPAPRMPQSMVPAPGRNAWLNSKPLSLHKQSSPHHSNVSHDGYRKETRDARYRRWTAHEAGAQLFTSDCIAVAGWLGGAAQRDKYPP